MKRILIIDDDEGIKEALKAILEMAGYEVVFAENGEFAEKLTDKDLPDLILLDYLLSGKDGRAIAKKYKNSDRLKNIPIIMLSAHPTAAKASLDAGANAFIPKPFDMNDLLEKVSAHISK